MATSIDARWDRSARQTSTASATIPVARRYSWVRVLRSVTPISPGKGSRVRDQDSIRNASGEVTPGTEPRSIGRHANTPRLRTAHAVGPAPPAADRQAARFARLLDLPSAVADRVPRVGWSGCRRVV